MFCFVFIPIALSARARSFPPQTLNSPSKPQTLTLPTPTPHPTQVDIPNVDDHVGKLEHMGRETVKKLQDVRASAAACGVELAVPDNRVDKVGEFRRLALLAEADGHLRQRLQQVLKLSKEKWEEARDHAMRAVVADSRMRIWYADKVRRGRCGL